MRSTKDASSACFTGSLSLWRGKGRTGQVLMVSRVLGGPDFDGFWHSIRGQTPSAKREIVLSRNRRLGERSGRAADDEVLGQRTKLMEGRVDLTGRITLDRTGGC